MENDVSKKKQAPLVTIGFILIVLSMMSFGLALDNESHSVIIGWLPFILFAAGLGLLLVGLARRVRLSRQ